jgi:hypothetical protein
METAARSSCGASRNETALQRSASSWWTARRYRRRRTNGRAYGWKGVAPVPKVSPVCAVALFPGKDQFAPLDGCQTIGEKPCDALTRRFLTLAAANTGPNI